MSQISALERALSFGECLSTRAKLADIGLASFARGSVAWEGDHVRLLLLPKDSKV